MIYHFKGDSMNEEEKKAIEYLKRHIIPYYGNKGRIEFMLNDTILNLIEKQQKEINKEWQDKIREKIKELEKEQEENRKELYNAIDCLFFKKIDIISDKIIINLKLREILKELLGENENGNK